MPTDDIFLVADYYQIGLFDKDFKFYLIRTDFNMDGIKFKDYNGDILNIEWYDVPEYNLVNGYVDTKNWKSIIEGHKIDI